MRTTIEIPENLRQKLVSEAIGRNKKGFSDIIVDALKKYFQTKFHDKKETVKHLRGCLTAKEYKQEMMKLKEGRGQWRT